ncbi:MAG: TolB family protein [bacterium]
MIFSKFEKVISEFLRRYPKLRNNMKLIYQRIIYFLALISGGNKNFENMVDIKCVYSKEKEHFFGYYDKSPWDSDGRYILTLQVLFSDRHPKKADKATIGMINIKENNTDSFITVTETKTWNLQQGAMLHWLGPSFKDKIIYNDLQNGQYISVIYNLKTKTEKIIERPVYSVSKNGKFALSLNFSRLHRLRPGYGYANIPDNTEDQLHPADDGIWYVDLEKNESRLIISLDQIANYDWDKTMEEAEHRFNHIDINPDGTRFSFLHRWDYKNETYSRLFTADIHGENIYCIANDKMVSHSCWKNNKQILVWCRQENIGDKYYLFTDQTDIREIIGDNILTQDGHPSYSPDGRYILTDTYPDRKRMRTLIIYDTIKNKRYDIAKLFAPFKYDGEVRCDLHPRWSRDGKQICFDSVHEGNRQLYVIDNPLIDSDKGEK